MLAFTTSGVSKDACAPVRAISDSARLVHVKSEPRGARIIEWSLCRRTSSAQLQRLVGLLPGSGASFLDRGLATSGAGCRRASRSTEVRGCRGAGVRVWASRPRWRGRLRAYPPAIGGDACLHSIGVMATEDSRAHERYGSDGVARRTSQLRERSNAGVQLHGGHDRHRRPRTVPRCVRRHAWCAPNARSFAQSPSPRERRTCPRFATYSPRRRPPNVRSYAANDTTGPAPRAARRLTRWGRPRRRSS